MKDCSAVSDVITDVLNRQARLCSIWFVCGAVTILLPLTIFGISRLSYQYSSDNEEADDNDNGTPWWFFGSGGDDGTTPPFLIATYLWSLLVFFGILFYGYQSITRIGADLSAIIAALVLFANYSILSMFLFAGVEGAVETEGPEVDEHGFCGQFGVMMYLTSICWVIFSISFALVFRHSTRRDEVTTVDVEPSDYRVHDSEFR